MPLYTIADAFHTPIGGIPYCRAKHLHHSCKASERMLEGIPINAPSVLLSGDGKRMGFLWHVRDYFHPSLIPHLSLTHPSLIPHSSLTHHIVGIRKKAESLELSANILKTLLA